LRRELSSFLSKRVESRLLPNLRSPYPAVRKPIVERKTRARPGFVSSSFSKSLVESFWRVEENVCIGLEDWEI